jgi:predicted HTH transcriptional regulator
MQTPQMSLFPTKRMSHRNDPLSSREAAVNHIATGSRSRHRTIVLDLVKHHPDCTAIELMEFCDLKEYQVRRRLSDLKNDDRVEHGPQRPCRVRGSMMVTWRMT